jgi:hypothetical protein
VGIFRGFFDEVSPARSSCAEDVYSESRSQRKTTTTLRPARISSSALR